MSVAGAGGRWSRAQWERAFPGTRYPAEIYEDPSREFEEGDQFAALYGDQQEDDV